MGSRTPLDKKRMRRSLQEGVPASLEGRKAVGMGTGSRASAGAGAASRCQHLLHLWDIPQPSREVWVHPPPWGFSPASSTLPSHRIETSSPMGETPGWENPAEPRPLPRALPTLPLGAGGSAPASAACASAAACQGGLSGSARSSPEPRRDFKT